jgi:nitrate reductase delta subunit
VIAGKSPIDVAKVPPITERTDALDRDWAEEPAFAGAPAAATPSAGTPTA